jgi:hypothetical protein
MPRCGSWLIYIVFYIQPKILNQLFKLLILNLGIQQHNVHDLKRRVIDYS